jgi:hypothetical protein
MLSRDNFGRKRYSINVFPHCGRPKSVFQKPKVVLVASKIHDARASLLHSREECACTEIVPCLSEMTS